MRYDYFFIFGVLWGCFTSEKSPCDTAEGNCENDTSPPNEEDTADDSANQSDSFDSADDSQTDTSTDPEDTATENTNSADPCEGIEICENFEDFQTGVLPTTSLWAVVFPDCSGLGEAIISNDYAHSGNNSIKFLGFGGYCDHAFLSPEVEISSIGPSFYGRFWMRIDNAFGMEHITFLAMEDEIEGKALRMGGQSQIIMWNRESDDATLPELSPTGISLSYVPPVQSWFCIQFKVDETTGTIETWVDDILIEGLVQDGVSTNDIDRQWIQQKPDWKPSLVDIKLGWESYGGGTNTIWYDDLAFSSSPLSCE